MIYLIKIITQEFESFYTSIKYKSPHTCYLIMFLMQAYYFMQKRKKLHYLMENTLFYQIKSLVTLCFHSLLDYSWPVFSFSKSKPQSDMFSPFFIFYINVYNPKLILSLHLALLFHLPISTVIPLTLALPTAPCYWKAN